MFGYVTINEAELKIKDFRLYRSFYCGVCRSLRRYGIKGRLMLNYDLTFLAVLLTALYEDADTTVRFRCPLHPMRKSEAIKNAYCDYAADMTVLLAYYQCLDHWRDERQPLYRVEAALLKPSIKRLAEQYPRQAEAVARYVASLHLAEAEHDLSLDELCGLTGAMLAEICVLREDVYSANLRSLGFYLGKFIYLMDAVEDLERDGKKGCFNPLLAQGCPSELAARCEDMLTALMAECARAFERLPVLLYSDILRNILYSGVWSKYELLLARRQKNAETQKEKENGNGSL